MCVCAPGGTTLLAFGGLPSDNLQVHSKSNDTYDVMTPLFAVSARDPLISHEYTEKAELVSS